MKKTWCKILSGILFLTMFGSTSLAYAQEGTAPEKIVFDASEVERTEVSNDEAFLRSTDSDIVFYRGTVSAEMISAQKDIWYIINTWADPEYFLNDNYRDSLTDAYYKSDMTNAQYNELKSAAQSAIAGCSTQYDKIKKLVGFVADRLFYDQDHSNKGTATFEEPYDVYSNRRGVCRGYAKLLTTLCRAVDIPCMNLPSFDHVYNAIYDSDSGKWIFADATWCSLNKYSDGKWNYRGSNYNFFDLSPEEIAELESHEVAWLEGLLENNAYYWLATDCSAENSADWSKKNWHLEFTNMKANQPKLVIIHGLKSYYDNKLYPVTQVSEYNLLTHKVFYDGLEEVYLPTYAKEILPLTFYGLTKLVSVIGGSEVDELTKIGSEAFRGCKKLNEVVLDNTKIKVIEDFAFANCESLEKIYLPNTLEEIGKGAFADSSKLTEFTIPKSVKSIGESAFHPNALLKVYDNSYGLTYARNNKLRYVILDGVSVSGISLNKTSLTLSVKETADLVATVSPSNASIKDIEWSSDNMAVVSVNNGKVTAIKDGTAVITAKALDGSGMSTSCKVTVAKAEPAQSLHFTYKTLALKVGEGYSMLVFDNSGEITNVTWSSSDSSVATINSEGRIKPLKAGKTTIKATLKGGSETASLELTVSSDLTGVPFSILYCPETFWIGRTYTLEAYLFYEKFTNVTWSSSDSSVVSVSSSGEVKALKAGKATITVKPNGTMNASASCTITVEASSSSSGGSSSTGSTSSTGFTTTDKTLRFGWFYKDGKAYWYEDGARQGTFDDPKGVLGDGTVRGREIYDPDSDGWYWLDSVYDGAKAVSKEVWMPYIYNNEKGFSNAEIDANANESGDMAAQVARAIREGSGKWVRYDSNGKMYKGWYTVSGADAKLYPDQAGNTYYYDKKTGLMAKGKVKIDGRTYYFDETTGALQK